MVTYPSNIRRSARRKPPVPSPRKHQRKILTSILFGCLVMSLFCLIGVLLWALISYYGQLEPAAAKGVPALIWLLSLFITSVLLTWLNRSGTVTPVLVVSLIATVASFFFMPGGTISFFPALGKTLLTMVAGVLGFSVTKILLSRQRQAQPRRSNTAVG